MSKFFIEIANIHGQHIQFEIIPFSDRVQLQNINGVAVLVKRDASGWIHLFKIQSHSIGHAMRTVKVHKAVELHAFDHSLYIAYLRCETPIERYAIYKEVEVPELNE